MLLNILTEVASAGYNEYFVKGMACIGCAIAVFGGIGPGISEGLAVKAAVEGVSRNPNAVGKVRSTLIIGCALAETTGLYGLLVSLLLLFFVAM